ncbi:molybdopterin synthase catalytic subunit [Mayamaea pseudoterrestris]|nr:molybdopterin synthase catalytic subunit [Mayamaea pseudoterrestris]
MDRTMAASSTNFASHNNEHPNFFIQVSEQLPILEECYNFVCDESCGAVATFVGTTRNNFDGKTVTKLCYEAYVPMAVKELQRLCHETRRTYSGVCKIAAVHVLGECPVGRPSVILAVSSPHRSQALHAVEYLINELKARVPIWKLEVYEGDEVSVWKENVEWKEGKATRVMTRHDAAGD